MSKGKKVKRCSRCGAILQSQDPNQLGYINSLVLRNYPDGVLLCNNCFNDVKNDQKETPNIELSSDYLNVFKNIKKSNSVLLYVIDLFSFEGFIPLDFDKVLDGLEVIVIGTKRDLLPKNTDDEYLEKYIMHQFKQANIIPSKIIIESFNNHESNEQIFNYLISNYSNRNIYIFGPKGSGKSTLLKDFLKYYKNNTSYVISSNNFNGTSLKGMSIPLSNSTFLYEIPGFQTTNSMFGVLEKPISNLIIPTKKVEAKKVTLSKKNFLIVSGLSLIQVLSDSKVSLKCYFSDLLEIKVKRGDPIKIFENILLTGNQTNTSYKYRNINDFDAYDFEITESGSRDIGILGLGWISFNGDNQKFRIFVPKGIYVYSTRSKIKSND